MDQTGVVLSVDFGTAFIRAARTALMASSGAVAPQLLEFGRLPKLRNVICLDKDRTRGREIGEDVFASGMDESAASQVHQWVPPDDQSAPDSELGRVIRLFLARVRESAGLNRPPDAAAADWQTACACAFGASLQQIEAQEKLFRAAEFPNPKGYDSALAALAWHTRSSPQPGAYLVIDCGATETRFAVCELDRAGSRKVVRTARSQPGGRDFDRLLAERLRSQLRLGNSLSLIESLELTRCAELLKEGFSRAWSQDKTSYEMVCQIGDVSDVAELRLDEFQALASMLQRSFTDSAAMTLSQANLTPQALAGVIVVGGGALWPWVGNWARTTFGSSRVQIGQFPEESIVCGLALLAAEASVRQPELPQPPPIRPPDESPIVRRKQDLEKLPPRAMVRRQASPRTAFWLEMLGGLFGFLGLGWFFAVGNVGIGAVALASWWFVLIASFLTFGGVAIAEGNFVFILLWILLYLGTPFLSGWFASRRIRSGTVDQNQVKRVEND